MAKRPDHVLYKDCADWQSASALSRSLVAAHGPARITQKRTSIYVDRALLGLLSPTTQSNTPQTTKQRPSKLETAINDVGTATFVAGRARSRTKAQSRSQRMIAELEHAYRHAPADAMSSWSKDTVCRFGFSIVSRVNRVAGLGVSILEYGGREIIDFGTALIDGRVVDHVATRSNVASKTTIATCRRLSSSAKPLVAAFAADPGTVGPALMVGALAAYTSSGGLDGDGGAPDLDIALIGIDAHRSLFTHSIVAGAVIETGLVSLVDLINRAHAYLPSVHDPLWDEINTRSARIGHAACRGASVGIAYHLGIDGLAQPAAYHNLPFSAPLEVHQGILTVNAGAEGGAAIAGPVIPEAKPARKRDVAGIAAGVITTVAALLFWG
ncbi:hypothetical protein LK996_11090 [Lysobacter sp. A6]|uniref:Uncharacterized protein n=1 Tax=Noviluteimonas lactosilytica TaxID=2888523 RepID=A0ABS8JJH6_9GAMM|nr:hypothetical protein [Lysobacter lactosilyticus]MCC8363613.1 hypothetical protein [Lysobacter lactosilyticus]